MSSARLAPRALRIANSFCRAIARVSTRLARFEHAISKISPTADSSTSKFRRRSLPTSSTYTGKIFTPKPALSVGFCSSRRLPITSISARACSSGRQGEMRGQHADDGVRNVIERNALSDDVSVCPEMALPIGIAQNGCLRVLWRGVEGRADRRRYSENLEEVRRNAGASHAFRFCSAGAIQVGVFHSRDAFEGAGLALPVGEVRVIGRDALANLCSKRGILFPDHDQTVRIAIGKFAEQDSIDHAEDSGVGADSQRQHEDHNRGEDWRPPRQAERMAEILQEVRRFHGNKDECEASMLSSAREMVARNLSLELSARQDFSMSTRSRR